LPLEAFPIERCAAIAAAIARWPAEAARILEANALDPEVEAALDRHYSDAIRKETVRGKTGLLRAYDAAYVAQLEKERGPITAEEHARLVVAAERGNVDVVLRELGVPPAAFMRIRRLWIAKSAADGELGARVRQAIEAERDR
jgi:hypothetical protein